MWPITETSGSGAKGLFLLFAAGKRPDSAAIRDFIGSQRRIALTHDPAIEKPVHLVAERGEQLDQIGEESAAHADLVWLELLRDGLMFDLIGLEPGDASAFPAIRNRFDIKEVPLPAGYEALQLLPGHHLAGGEGSLPIARAMMAVARDLVHHFAAVEAIVWPAAESAIGRRFFESVITAWLDGGPFPALGLTAFRQTVDGALQSVGLGFWIDQELRIEPPLSNDTIAATRLAVRLINQLVLVGGIEGSERIVAPDGNVLVMRPSRNGKFVRVWLE